MNAYYSAPTVSENIVKDERFSTVCGIIEDLCHDYHNFSFDPTRPVVRLHEPTFGGDEITSALSHLMTTRVTMGKKNLEFEQLFAEYSGAKYAVTSNSGSSANLLALSVLCNPKVDGHLSPGDEVIVSALSWSTTVWPLVQHGLIPVIVDIDPATLNIDIKEVEKAISPKTRAIMPVHVYGNPCEMDQLVSICDRHNLFLIEDCCEALGASYKGKSIGTFGDLATFSFYYSHHITTLEGGITITDDLALEDIMRITRAHGWVRESKFKNNYKASYPTIDDRFLFVNHGYNLRITDLQASIGIQQIRKLDRFVGVRRKVAGGLRSVFEPWENVFRQQKTSVGGESSWFGFPLICSNDSGSMRDGICHQLNLKGIETRPIICGNVALQPAMKLFPHRVVGELRFATEIMNNGFSIGCHHAMGDEHIAYIREVVGGLEV